MRTLDKIRLYKRLLLATIALNVFSVSAGLVVGYDHWTTKLEWQNKQKELLSQWETTAHAQELTFVLLKPFTADKNSPEYEENLFARWKTWEQLQITLGELKEDRWLNTLANENKLKTGPGPDNLQNLLVTLSESQQRYRHEVARMGDEILAVTHQVLWVAALTLIFGVLLPGTLFYLTARALNFARKELQVHVRQWVDEWMKQSQMASEEPFKSPEFWANMALITLEMGAHYTHHPMMDLSADISRLIRNEMSQRQRSSAEKAA